MTRKLTLTAMFLFSFLALGIVSASVSSALVSEVIACCGDDDDD